MSSIRDLSASAFRAFQVDGDPTSGVRNVDKAEVRHLFSLIAALASSVSVKSATTTAQPASPAIGDVYILAATHTGAAWTAFTAYNLAIFLESGWLEVAPSEGTIAFVQDTGAHLYREAGAWPVFGSSSTAPGKQVAKAATTANIALSGAQTIDGVSIVAGDRVLVKDQSAPAANGIYDAAAGAWTRASDANTWGELIGAIVPVAQGSTQADTIWQCTSDAGGTLGSTAVAFVEASSGSIDATRWGYLAGVSAFVGGGWNAANLPALISSWGGEAAFKTAMNLEADVDYLAYGSTSANGRTLVNHTFAQMRADLDLEAGIDFYSMAGADTQFLAKSGGTLTNFLTAHADPTSALHVATKQYVDNLAAGLDPKGSCVVATTANITRSAPQTIDGVAVIAGDRVLVKDQTAPAENGIFVVAAGAWTRATDMDTWAEVPGANVWIEQGSTNSDKSYVCTANAGGTLNTTAITWTQFGGTGAFAAASHTHVYTDVNNITTARLLGRTTAGTGAAELISLGADLSFSGATLQTAAFTGDVTKAAGGTALTIAAGVVTYAKVASAAIATAAELQAGTASKLVDAAVAVSAGDVETIAYAASTTLDFTTFVNAKISLTGNITFNNPTTTGMKGRSGVIELWQDATGSRTATWGTNFRFAGGTDIVLTTTPNMLDVIGYVILSDGTVLLSAVKDAKN